MLLLLRLSVKRRATALELEHRTRTRRRLARTQNVSLEEVACGRERDVERRVVISCVEEEEEEEERREETSWSDENKRLTSQEFDCQYLGA